MALHDMTAIVLMGVSGSGKTTIGELLARTLGWQYQEGDALHSPANVEKMRTGIPLTDADRWPWLEAIAGAIDVWRKGAAHGVVTCSALKHVYRDVIVGTHSDVVLVYLHGTPMLLAERLQSRTGHYMPASLLNSQIATLEEPADNEHAITVDIDANPEQIVETILRRLR